MVENVGKLSWQKAGHVSVLAVEAALCSPLLPLPDKRGWLGIGTIMILLGSETCSEPSACQ
eukprot:scaffold47_cov172-Ochromonas_danica.AAC.10